MLNPHCLSRSKPVYLRQLPMGAIGYIPTCEAFEEVVYEVAGGSPISRDAADAMLKQGLDTLRDLAGRMSMATRACERPARPRGSLSRRPMSPNEPSTQVHVSLPTRCCRRR